MNVERVALLEETLRAGSFKANGETIVFDMNRMIFILDDYDVRACIIGFAYILATGEIKKINPYSQECTDAVTTVAEWLDIDIELLMQIGFPQFSMSYNIVEAEAAADYLHAILFEKKNPVDVTYLLHSD